MSDAAGETRQGRLSPCKSLNSRLEARRRPGKSTAIWEIRVKACQHLVQDRRLTRWRVHVGDGCQVREDPYVMASTEDDAFRLVGVYEKTASDLVKNLMICRFVLDC